MRVAVPALAALLIATPALAHDVWLQPHNFWVAAGQAVPVAVWVGHGSFRQPWGVAVARVRTLRSIDPAGSIDHRGDLPPGTLGVETPLRFPRAGTQLLVLESDPAKSDLPAIRFNDYAKVEGLSLVLATRAANGASDRDGRESYVRRAKAIIQIGPFDATRQAHIVRPVGLSLEIVPEKSPYALAPGEALPVRILYRGKPLAGATVKLNNLAFDARPLETKLTDTNGRASFELPQTGFWQMNVIWSVPVKGDPDADFATTFSSLTFGFPPRR